MVFTSIKQRRNRLSLHRPSRTQTEIERETDRQTLTMPSPPRPATDSPGRKAVSWLAKGTRNAWDVSVDADGLVRWQRRGGSGCEWGERGERGGGGSRRKLLNGRVDLHLPRWLLSSFLLSVILPENSCGSWVPASAAGLFPLFVPLPPLAACRRSRPSTNYGFGSVRPRPKLKQIVYPAWA